MYIEFYINVHTFIRTWLKFEFLITTTDDTIIIHSTAVVKHIKRLNDSLTSSR